MGQSNGSGRWLPALLLLLAVLIAYIPAMRGSTIWDDARYLTENPTLRSEDGLWRIWSEVGATIQYYPLVFTTYWIESRLWGFDPFGYHLVNVLLHAFSSLLLWRILRRLAVPGALLAAAIFALHPIEVESVAWIAERKNVLSGFFYLASLLIYLRFASLDRPVAAAQRSWRSYSLALVLFLCALLSKTVTSTLPAAILLLLWWKRRRVGRRDLLPLIPMFVAGIAFGLLTVWMERGNVGARGPEWAFSFLDRTLIAGRAVWFYLSKVLLPIGLTFNYPRWEIDPSVWWQVLAPVALLATAVLLWGFRGRLGKAPLVTLLFFVGTLLPALGFINVYPMRYSFVADHFQYLAGIGPIALASALLATVAERRLRGGPAARRLRVAAAVLLLFVLGAMTWNQGRIYKDQETLWRATLQSNPSSFLSQCNLGTLLLDRGDAAEAEKYLAEAVRLKPDFHEAHGSLGKALIDQGKLEEGKSHYLEALRIRPDMAWAWCSLGNLLLQQGKPEEAIPRFREALRLQPDFLEARFNLGNALVEAGELEEAVVHYKAALKLRPNEPRTHNNLANTLARLDRLEEAANQYREALRLQPNYATGHRNLAVTLTRLGKVDEAINEFWLALRSDPTDPVAHFQLGELLRHKGYLDGAIQEYRATLRLDPDHAAAREALEATLELRAAAGTQPEEQPPPSP